MNLFDINIHLPFLGEDTNSLLLEESRMGSKELIRGVESNFDKFKDNIGNNFMIFNENISPEEVFVFSQYVCDQMRCSFFTQLFDFRNSNTSKMLELKESGINAIKFHSYVQSISDKDFLKVLDSAVCAEKLNLPIFIDTSFGTTGMYEYDNLKLAAYILRKITKVPVILLHSGGARVIDAFLLAASCPNVYLDASFSIGVYLGSSIEKDLSFAYKSIGFERVLYGSDAPYTSHDKSLSSVIAFFDNQKISIEDQEMMLAKSWMNIFNV